MKKLEIFAIPFVLAFFSFSTPCDVFFRFLSVALAAAAVLLSFISILRISAAAEAAASRRWAGRAAAAAGGERGAAAATILAADFGTGALEETTGTAAEAGCGPSGLAQ